MTSQTLNERRDRTRKEIINLIEKRNTTLSQYYNLAKNSEGLIAEDQDKGSNITLELLEEFCQELVDYMATGHFELYRRIEEGKERRDDITSLASKIMPRINDTTQIAVAFNDLYDNTSSLNITSMEQLPKQLEKLGEELATRIDLEDQLIYTLLSKSPLPVTTVSA